MASPNNPLTTLQFNGTISARSSSSFVDVYTKTVQFTLPAFAGIWADIVVDTTPTPLTVVGAAALNFIFISNNDPSKALTLTLTNQEQSTVILNPLGMYLVMGAQITTLILTGSHHNQAVSYMLAG